MRKIKTLRIENFKAFATPEVFELNSRHMLLFGTNGSGKSSIFWSLYTFLQCGMRHPMERQVDIAKYFDRGNESMHNIYSAPDSHSEIEVVFEDDTTNYVGNVLGKDNYNSIHKSVVKDANKGADFINHRFLMNFYNYRNSQSIDLWPVFQYQILPFVFEGDQSLHDSYEEIVKNTPVIRPKQTKDLLVQFNLKVSDLIDFVNTNVNAFLKDHFWDGVQKFKIELIYLNEATFEDHSNKTKRDISSGKIELRIESKKPDGTYEWIPKPQSFLNESVLNAIALSIRLMVGKKKATNLQTRILALDDLLISLDMANRMKIIRILLKEYADDHQILLFTHDRGFYKLVLNEIQSQREDWYVKEFYATQPGQNPEIIDGKDDLQKAEDEFKARNYDATANYLRKYLEDFLREATGVEMEMLWKNKNWIYLKQYLDRVKSGKADQLFGDFKRLMDKTIPVDHLEKLGTDVDADGDLNVAERGKIKSLEGKVIGFAKKVYKREKEGGEADLDKLISEIEKITDRILNPGSHGSEAPFFEEEMDYAIETIKQFKDLLLQRQQDAES